MVNNPTAEIIATRALASVSCTWLQWHPRNVKLVTYLSRTYYRLPTIYVPLSFFGVSAKGAWRDLRYYESANCIIDFCKQGSVRRSTTVKSQAHSAPPHTMSFSLYLKQILSPSFYSPILRPGKRNGHRNRSSRAIQMITSTCTCSVHDSTKKPKAETETSYHIQVLNLSRAIEAFFTTPNIIQVYISNTTSCPTPVRFV